MNRPGHYLTVLLIVLLVLTLQAGQYPVKSSPPSFRANAQSGCTSSNTLRMTLVVPPTSLNPNTLLTSATATPALLTFWEYYGVEGAPAPNGTYDQGLSATDWVSHNSNYTQWTFNIKPGLKWSDGSNVTSTDLLASYGPKFYFNSSYDLLSMGPEVKSAYVLNSSTAVYVLSTSDAQWANKMSPPTIGDVIFPASIVNKYGPSYPNLGTDKVEGPFYVSNYTAGQFQMTMLRNPYYTPQPAVCQININYVETLSQTATNLLSGSTDVAQVEYSNAPSILKNPNLKLLDEKGMFITTLEYNVTVYPFNMTAFRQALAYGINQSAIVNQAFNGYASTAYDSMGTVPFGSGSYWYNPNIKKYSFNQGQSLVLLSSIGITKGTDGLLHYPNGTSITLTLWTDTDSTVDAIAASSVKSDLQKLGFSVNLQTTTSQNIIGDYSTNVNNIARTGIILSTTEPPNWGFILTDVLPGWDVYFVPTIPSYTWQWPPGVEGQYQSNLSAIYSTDNNTQLRQYAFNIQSIDAQNLPTIVLAYPDELWGFNTQHWTNLPSQGQYLVYGGFLMNPHPLVDLLPASSAAGQLALNGTTMLVVTLVAMIIVAASIGAIALRRRRKPSS